MDPESSPSSSSSSSGHIWKYDVFLSLSPEDTSNDFTSYLYFDLLRNEVKTLVHEEDKKEDYSTSPKLLKEIEQSRISIVVFSRNYAASTSRLEELAKIAECIDSVQQKHTVFPVFHDFNPSEVRKLQRGVYHQQVFAEYEERFKGNLQKVERWRNAITKVANLQSRWIVEKESLRERTQVIYNLMQKNKMSIYLHEEIKNLLDKENRERTQVIYDIVKRAKKILGIKASSAMDEIVGIQPRLEALEHLVDLGSNDVVRVIGICGMRASGKTKLASHLYHKISHKFDASCFLSNIRAVTVMPNRLSSLQEQLLRQILQENLKIRDVQQGSSLIATRLRNLKILLVLDDVPHIQILEDLVGNLDWFGVGSRIIITTRDEHILEGYGAHQIYKVEPLNKLDTFQFFKSHLLSDMVNEIFLDIACFFVGENINDVIEILIDCKFYPTQAIEALIKKSLITISHQKIQMHYMLQELGRKIIQQEFPNKPGKRSRLWVNEDFRHVIETNAETGNIKALVLNPKIPGETPLHADALSKMDGLEILIIRNVNFSGVLNGLSNYLRYVSWHRFPFTCLPSSFEPNKLFHLIMSDSNITQLWKESKTLPNLKSLDLHGSKSLMETPDFERLPNLEKLDLEGCIGLLVLDPSITFLKKLKFLNLRNCINLVSVPNNLFGLSSLEILNVAACSKFAECLDFDDWTSSTEGEEVLSNQDFPLFEEIGKQLQACGINREHAKSIEATSSSTISSDKYPIAECIVGLDEIDDVSDSSYMKALEKFKDPYWRQVFLTMSDKRKKAWLNNLV